MTRYPRLLLPTTLWLILVPGCPGPPPASETDGDPACPHAPLPDDWRAEVRRLINEERSVYSREPLEPSSTLDTLAEEYVGQMVDHGFFGHDNPVMGVLGIDRLAEWMGEHGYRKMGENLARGPRSPAEAVEEWMHSPPHRDNILDAELTEIGLSVQVRDDDYCLYWMTLFGQPRQ